MHSKKLWTGILIISVFFVFLLPGIAWAQGGLMLSTPYPGVSVVPGETVTFSLEVRNSGLASQKFDLALVSGPKGWPTLFKGGGMIVHQVFVASGQEKYVDFQVEVPQDAKTGSYSFLLEARGGGARSTLELNLQVKDVQAGSEKLVVQYPELSGPSDATFKFRVDLVNNSAQERSYSLGAQAPDGWQVSISPAYEDKQIASLSLKAGASQGLDINVKPPKNVKAGKYEIPVQAVSAGRKATAVLKVNITGTYKLEVTTPSGRLNADAAAGKENPVTLVIKNNGSTDLQGINFSAAAPDKWSVTFKPEQIDVLPAGESRQVTAFIKPDGRAIAGDYLVNISASTQMTSADATLRVTVKTPTLWGLIGIFIVALVIAGVGWTFHKYGRR
ncbi:MAG: hypothetical protein PWP65_1500 [Clostridia bacterium]|nr:hypothetical protein [Clostridia bacterium]